jgi:hypothetical protein
MMTMGYHHTRAVIAARVVITPPDSNEASGIELA